MYTAKSATATQGTGPTGAATATAAGTGPAKPTEAAAAEAGAAKHSIGILAAPALAAANAADYGTDSADLTTWNF